MATLAPPCAFVNPIPTEAESALADLLAFLADGGDPDEYRPGWSDPEPTAEAEAEWLGYRLGADGIPAELPSPVASERAAFDAGHNSGDDYLWTVDPLFAAHLKEQAELSAYSGW